MNENRGDPRMLFAGQTVVLKLDVNPTSERRPFSGQKWIGILAGLVRVEQESSSTCSFQLLTFYGRDHLPVVHDRPGRDMYSNDYDDDGALMNSYIRWSKR